MNQCRKFVELNSCNSCKRCPRIWVLSGKTPKSSPEPDGPEQPADTGESMVQHQVQVETPPADNTQIDLGMLGVTDTRCFCQALGCHVNGPGRARVESPNPGEVSHEVCIEMGELGVIDGNATTQLPRWQEILKDELKKITQSLETDSSAKVGEIILGITGQGAVTLLGYSLSSSQTQKYPSAALDFVVAANGVGFISTLTAIYLRRKRRATASILGKIGAIFAACGIIGAMGMYLPEESMTWITAGACLIPVLAVALD
ncbi:hypothetical protein F0562_033062 [Nyssa sinensis]|uniref:Transmembrane protein n=1 Tax=Nyssa sinensis TaxID=561372 RepID=A0A5J5AUX7_9ASTE|nr:hypothetical protein F0562_033062 [Nyssa sinensis]